MLTSLIRFRHLVVIVTFLSATADTFGDDVNFDTDIWPIIEYRCVECHGPDKQEEGLRFDDLEWLSDDELLGAGDPSKSLIYEMVTLATDDDEYMPKKRERLSESEIDTIRKWIESDASAEGWVVPENIVVRRSGYKSSEILRVTELGKDVGPAPEDAMEAIRALGGVAVSLGDNNNLVRVDFERAEGDIGDAHLELLAPLKDHVTVLGLGNTAITDAGLLRLAMLSKLTELNLGNTQIGDAGLKGLAGLTNLERLNLIHTQVTDKGLESISELRRLKRLYAWRSKISRVGAQNLIDVVPGLQVDLGSEN